MSNKGQTPIALDEAACSAEDFIRRYSAEHISTEPETSYEVLRLRGINERLRAITRSRQDSPNGRDQGRAGNA